MSTQTTELPLATSGNDMVTDFLSHVLSLPFDKRTDLYSSLMNQDTLLTDIFINTNGGLIVRREEIGSARANELLDLNYGLQRDLKTVAINLYTSEMKTGRWNPDSMIQLVACREDNREYLVDGQNRLSAIIASDTVQPMLVHRTHVSTLDEVKRIYTSIDGGVKRTTNDKLKALTFGHDGPLKKTIKGKLVDGVQEPDQLVPDVSKLTHVQSAIKLMQNGFYGVSARTRIPTPMDKMLPLIYKFEEHAARFYDAIKDRELQHRMDGSPVMAVALLTIAAEHEKVKGDQAKVNQAVKFWSKVAQKPAEADLFNQDADKINAASPAVQLYYLILNNNVDALNTGVAARLIARAWNAFIKRESVADQGGLNPDDPAVGHNEPIKISGTEYDGKHRVYITLGGEFEKASLVDPQIEINRLKKEAAALAKAEAKAEKAKAKEEKTAEKVEAKAVKATERVKAKEAKSAERVKAKEAKSAERVKATAVKEAEKLKVKLAKDEERLKAAEKTARTGKVVKTTSSYTGAKRGRKPKAALEAAAPTTPEGTAQSEAEVAEWTTAEATAEGIESEATA